MPTNISIGWKSFQVTYASLFGNSVSDLEKQVLGRLSFFFVTNFLVN